MKIIAKREAILGPLQAVIGVVERRQTMPILANVLLAAKGGRLSVTATDLEVELVASSEVDVQRAGEVTVPGRKLLDICRGLPDGVEITLTQEGERMVVRAKKSRYTLSTLPATEFPTVEEINAQQTLKLAQKDFKKLLDKTHFSMAQQDVRYYLNGMLLETSAKVLRSVATDGHRLALCEVELAEGAKAGQQVIVPRKGVLELQRILGSEDQPMEVAIGSNHVRVQIGDIRFTSKLIDGRFPEYGRVIPNNPPMVVTASRDELRHALQRAAILSNEKYRGIRFAAKTGQLTIQSHNPEQEEAEEQLEVMYDGIELDIGFNVNYLGIVGAIGTGIVVNPDFGGAGIVNYVTGAAEYPGIVAQVTKQALGVAVTIGWSAVGSLIVWVIARGLTGGRVSKEVEAEGVDYAEHGEVAYHS